MVLLSPSYASQSPALVAHHHSAHHAPAVLASSQSSPPAGLPCACQSGRTQNSPQPPRQPLTAAERAALLRRRRSVIVARCAALANGRARVSRPATVTDENGQPVALFHPSPRRSALLCADCAEPVLAPSERAALRLDVALDRDRIEWELGRAAPCRWLAIVPTLAPRGVA